MRKAHALLLFAFVGCGESDSLDLTLDPTFTSTPEPYAAPTLDEEFLRVDREEVPGFAGEYFDDDGARVVALKVTDESQMEQIASIARAWSVRAQNRLPIVAVEPRVRYVQYSFGDLVQIHDAVAGPALGTPGFVYLDIDERRNDIAIGVESATAAEALRLRLSEVNVPAAAVRIEVTEKLNFMYTVRDSTRPVPGGMQVSNSVDQTLCTMSFSLRRAAPEGGWLPGYGFATASHCSEDSFNADDNSVYRQPNSGGGSIGVEVVDRAHYNCGLPFNISCRRSDAAYNQFADSTHADFGSIARIDDTPDQYSASSLVVSSTTPRIPLDGIRIDADLRSGEEAHKVGRTSGWSFGGINQTCFTATVSGYYFRCVYSAPTIFLSGDSGAPVFMYWHDLFIGRWEGYLMGIAFAGNSSGNLMVFGSMEGVMADLGSIDICDRDYSFSYCND